MNDSTRRRFLRVSGIVGTIGLAGCSQLQGGSDIQDTDGDGVIDSEDYAPRDASVQDAEDVEEVGSTEQDVGDEDQSTENQDQSTEQPPNSGVGSLLLRAPLNGRTTVNRANKKVDFDLSTYHSPTPGVSGRFGNARRFSRNLSEAGPDAIIFDIPEEIDFGFSGSHDFSVKAHFNPDSLTGPAPRQTQKDHPNPFLFQSYGQYQVNIQLNDDGGRELGFSIDSSGNEGFYSSIAESVPIGEWTSFVMTWDSSDNEAKLYANGVLELSENTDIPFESREGDAQPEISGFGARAGRDSNVANEGDKGFDGRMDELQIYDTVLTEEQARALHTQPTL